MPENDNYEKGYLMKNLVLVAIFFTITPLTLLASVISLMSLSSSRPPHNSELVTVSSPEQRALVYSSSTKPAPNVSTEIIAGDARPQIIKNYLERSKSPLIPHANKVVEAADKYGLDFRLLVAIAQKESGLCRVIPHGSHNCWGWGIHSKGTLMFESYDEAIETVSKGLREKYIDKGFVTTEQIMKKYAHPDSTTWADGVNAYMAQME